MMGTGGCLIQTNFCYATHTTLNISKGNKVEFSQIYARKREV